MFCCDKLGHYASDCPDKHLKLQEVVEKKEEDTHEADELMMNEVVYLNERKVNPNVFEADLDTMNVWYLDNGASNHMSGNRLFFYELNETIIGKVRFGDDSQIDIKGKGSERFILKDGEKKVLNNVYYILGLRSNIISLGQATEVGCEVRMKDQALTLYDRNGRLMVRTTRSRNRLYKVVLQADQDHCLQIASASGTSMWHARLGHINSEKLKMMINKELIVGVPKLSSGGEETCVPCLLGKQTRRSFPQATQYRALKPLELVYGDLCGPISPQTPAQKLYIFVLIDDHTRYMWTILLKEKSEVFEKFIKFKAHVEKETQNKVVTFRTDRGGEFLSLEFQEYCENMALSDI